jgi:nucleotide-binding universal stress UspA family protein
MEALPFGDASMFRHVLVALDASAQSQQVLALAATLGTPHTRFHLLCAVDPSFDTGAPVGAALRSEYAQADAEQRIAEAVLQQAYLQLREQGLDASTELAAGDPATLICDQAAARGCDLIVIGHRHLSRLARWVDRSVGRDVIEHASCPVLVEPRHMIDTASGRTGQPTTTA